MLVLITATSLVFVSNLTTIDEISVNINLNTLYNTYIWYELRLLNSILLSGINLEMNDNLDNEG